MCTENETRNAWKIRPVQRQNSSKRNRGCVTHCCKSSRKIYALFFEAVLAISLLLMEATLRKTWSQREGPELCNVWMVLSQVRLPCPLDYLALRWVMIITLSFEIDMTDCIDRRLTWYKKCLQVCINSYLSSRF